MWNLISHFLTFAGGTKPVNTFCDIAVLAATSEHPVLNTMFTAPRTWLATILALSLPQAHVGSIRTWFRIPARPSFLLYPQNCTLSPPCYLMNSFS